MKETECKHLYCLLDLIVRYTQRQNLLFRSKQTVYSPVIQELLDRIPVDSISIEKDISQTLRQRVLTLQREKEEKLIRNDSWISNSNSNPNATVSKPLVFNPSSIISRRGNNKISTTGFVHLGSPLVSDLLFKTNVLERRSSNLTHVVNEAWKTTLAF